jgi:transcriptional regulator with XRE-family HTH domain
MTTPESARRSIGLQIRAARTLLGWSQVRLALSARLDHSTISKLESGRRKPQTETLDQLREVLEARGVALTNDPEGEEAMAVITLAQIRGARAMLGIDQFELGRLAGLSVTGIANIERGASKPRASTLRSIQSALETAGVIFIAESGEEGIGIRLRKAKQ